MAVTLQKGQKVDLTKSNPGISCIMVGLGWDPVHQGGGLFSKKKAIDCDASVIMLNENAKVANKENIIYFGHLQNKNASVKHMGDNLTGDGDGDDEQIQIELNKIPTDIHRLVFVVNIYDCKARNQNFGMVQNAFIRLVDSNKNQEIIRYHLTDQYAGKTALIVGEVYRHQGEWKFAAIGEGTNELSLSEIVQRYT